MNTEKQGELLTDVLVRIGFAKSKREARYLITSGAVSLSAVPRPQASATVAAASDQATETNTPPPATAKA